MAEGVFIAVLVGGFHSHTHRAGMLACGVDCGRSTGEDQTESDDDRLGFCLTGVGASSSTGL